MYFRDLLLEAPDIKKDIIGLVKKTQDPALLNKVLTTLKSSGLPSKLKSVIEQDEDAAKFVNQIASTIVNMDGTAEEKFEFVEQFPKGFIDVKKLLDGQQHSFSELIKNPFALKLFSILSGQLASLGVGPGEVALAVLSPKISWQGRKPGGGDLEINGKKVELKAKLAKGGRWVDARKARMNMPAIKAEIEAATGQELDAKRLGVEAWVNNIRPLIRDPNQLKRVAKTIAKSNFNFTETIGLENALVTGDAASIKDAWLETGFNNYKEYSGFDGMLLADVGSGLAAQYFEDYDSMRGLVKVDTIYMYGPEGESMPQVTLKVAKSSAPTIVEPTAKTSKVSTGKSLPKEPSAIRKAAIDKVPAQSKVRSLK